MSWPTTTGLRNADRFRERMNANGRCFHVAAVLGNIGIADTGDVGGDDGEFVLKLVIRGRHIREVCV